MTALNDDLPDDILIMRDLLNEVADLYLNLHSIEIVRTQETSKFDADRDALLVNISRSTLADELEHATSIYLFESAHELKALSILLDRNQIAGSMEVISRAVIERCGRVSWLLDHNEDVTPAVRSARIALEIAVSWQHYRQIIQSFYPGSHDAVKVANARFREMRSQIEVTFQEIEKEQIIGSDGELMSSPEIKSWVLGGVAYPEYTQLATWAWYVLAKTQRERRPLTPCSARLVIPTLLQVVNTNLCLKVTSRFVTKFHTSTESSVTQLPLSTKLSSHSLRTLIVTLILYTMS
jgi:hypothetical protein